MNPTQLNHLYPSGGIDATHNLVDQVGLGSLMNFVSERFNCLDIVLQETALRHQMEFAALREDVATYPSGRASSSKKKAKPKEDPRDKDEFRIHFLASGLQVII